MEGVEEKEGKERTVATKRKLEEEDGIESALHAGQKEEKARRKNDAEAEEQVQMGSTRKKSPATKTTKVQLSPDELEEEKGNAAQVWADLLNGSWHETWWREDGTLDTEKIEAGWKGGEGPRLGTTLSDRGGPHGIQNARTAHSTMQTQSQKGWIKQVPRMLLAGSFPNDSTGLTGAAVIKVKGLQGMAMTMYEKMIPAKGHATIILSRTGIATMMSKRAGRQDIVELGSNHSGHGARQGLDGDSRDYRRKGLGTGKD